MKDTPARSLAKVTTTLMRMCRPCKKCKGRGKRLWFFTCRACGGSGIEERMKAE